MNAWRACVRLWAFGSAGWIAFWAWNYAGKCFTGGNGLMWCPTIDGNSVVPTTWLRMGLNVFGWPLGLLIAGLALAWTAKTSGNDLDRGTG